MCSLVWIYDVTQMYNHVHVAEMKQCEIHSINSLRGIRYWLYYVKLQNDNIIRYICIYMYVHAH